MTAKSTDLPHAGLVFFLLLVAVIRDASGDGSSMRMDQLFVPKILCNAGVDITCDDKDPVDGVVYTNGCQKCVCKLNITTCSRVPKCRREESADKDGCDYVRQQTREIAKKREPCLTGERVCPKYPGAVFTQKTPEGCCSECKCEGKKQLKPCVREKQCYWYFRRPVYYNRVTDKFHEEDCAEEVEFHGKHFPQYIDPPVRRRKHR